MPKSLKELNLKSVYSTTRDDLISEFYNPVLENAIAYSRITGFFSPKVLALAARGLSKMITNGGKIRILTSIKVDPEVYESMSGDAPALDETAVPFFDANDLKDKLQRDYLKLFLILLKRNIIELRVAVLPYDMGILHEKVGIIEGIDGSLSFSGSNNETVYGWTMNAEKFKVFPEWKDSTADFFKDDRDKFEEYWSGGDPYIKVVPINEAFKERVLRVNEADDDLEVLVKRIDQEEKDHLAQILMPKTSARTLRDYQQDAIDRWIRHGYKYIFEMATGSGKTFTSLNGLLRFKENKGFLRCVIVVPLITLVEQWETEIRSTLSAVSVVIAAGTNPKWKRDVRQFSQAASLGSDMDFVVITTYSTFSTQDFRDHLDGYPRNDLILVADEMHNLVTENNIETASNQKFQFKLGLSATPTRLWKQDESKIARNLFGGQSFVYSLGDAIREKALVEYEYHIQPVHLTEEEYEEYVSLSREASRLSHYVNHDSKEASPLARILTRRATIKKQAENKFFVLDQLIDKLKHEGNFSHTLIYVDSNQSLENAQRMLTHKHIKTSKFTGNESLETRNTVMKALDLKQIEAIVAIKCLDEGVDIPSARNGIFLSNNTDPREYVQRLGRVLRRHEESGKSIAYIYDFIVLPPQSTDTSDNIARNLVKAEIVRSKFFEELAKNSRDVKSDIGSMLDLYGFYFEPEELMVYNADKDEL